MDEVITPIKVTHNRERWYFRPGWVFASLLLFSLLFFLVLLRVPRVDGQLIGSDGAYYYVFVRSIVVDHDLNFSNEYTYYHLAGTNPGLTPTGLVPNKYAIGPALLWMPFFLVAHVIALVCHTFGYNIVPDGYGYLYQSAISIGSIVYGTLGFWCAFRCASRLFSQRNALVAVVVLWLASNAFYYMVFEPSMSHMVSLFSVALLLTIWFTRIRNNPSPGLGVALMLGAAGGLVLLVRLQDAPFLLLPYGTLLIALFQAFRTGDHLRTRRLLLISASVVIMTLLVFSPQMLAWHILYGTWVLSPYLNDHTPAFYWFQPQIGAVLFSTFHGLFTWHPIFLCALLGILLLLRSQHYLALGMLMLLVLDVYIVAAWWSWWQGDSFGGRMFLNAMWLWVLGLAAFLEWLRARQVVLVALLVSVLLIGWNGLSLVQYRLGFVPMSRPLTWQQMTVDRLTLPLRLLKR